MAAWLRHRIGSPLAGWRTVGTWSGTQVAGDHGYIISDDAKVIQESARAPESLSVTQALDSLRSTLSIPGRCVRLIGLSGVGKTRFVEALFEQGAGNAPPLDAALSVYTDFADDVEPTAREMARRLIDTAQRAILVVDNCNPSVHADLAAICSGAESTVSLLTVEYDVREDEPEGTEVFRLTTGSAVAVETWLTREFPHVSPVDRRTIAGFSDGNFRVAKALADTVRQGEDLGRLRSQELFERLFTQRNVPDQRLLKDAEALALAYSFDGEDEGATGELAVLGNLVGRSVPNMFDAVADLRSRNIVQARGRWRAVLPQAIANRLAANALRRIPRGVLDTVWDTGSTRLLKSMSRRLGYLHDSTEAKATVDRWLGSKLLQQMLSSGETGIEILSNLAPASPTSVLLAVERELDGERGADIICINNRHRGRWIRLLKALAYSSDTFERSAMLLARFYSAEPEGHKSDSAERTFEELFHIRLSGTRASVEQRISVIRALLQSSDQTSRRAANTALKGLLKTSLFSSTSSFDFGARPRDFGWYPSTREEIGYWFSSAIALVLAEIKPLREAKAVLGEHVRGLWRHDEVRPAIEAAAEQFLAESGGWIDGWVGLRAFERFEAGDTTDDQTKSLIDRLRPCSLLERARAAVLPTSFLGIGLTDDNAGNPANAWNRASEMAAEIGKSMALQEDDLSKFLPEVVSQQGAFSFEFGRGLGLGTLDHSATWKVLSEAYGRVTGGTRNPQALGGFLSEVQAADPVLAGAMLDTACQDETLRQRLPFFQSRVSLEAPGLQRLQRLAESGCVDAWTFTDLATGQITAAPTHPLISLLRAIFKLTGGPAVATEILHLRLRFQKDEGGDPEPELCAYGRSFLQAFDFGPNNQLRDYKLGDLVELCFSGNEHRDAARAFCARLLKGLKENEIYAYDSQALITALLKTQAEVSLDCFVDQPDQESFADELFEASTGRSSPLETVDLGTLLAWAQAAPGRRFARLGSALPIFRVEGFDDIEGLSQHFLAVLRQAPDKAAVLGDTHMRVHPNSWSGSLIINLNQRKELLAGLSELGDAGVDQWLAEANEAIDHWIEEERRREGRQEESFE